MTGLEKIEDHIIVQINKIMEIKYFVGMIGTN
jgi:hypothetical protein